MPGLDIYQIPIGEEGPRCSLVDILEGFAGEVIPTLFLAALKINKFIKVIFFFLFFVCTRVILFLSLQDGHRLSQTRRHDFGRE